MKDNEFFVYPIIGIGILIYALISYITFIVMIFISDFSWGLLGRAVFLMLVILPSVFIVWTLFTMLSKIRINEDGITKIILKKTVRFFPWDKILYVKKEYFNSITPWVYFSIDDKLYKSVSSLRLSKYVIYFAYNKKGIRLIQRYCPNKELLAQLEHLS